MSAMSSTRTVAWSELGDWDGIIHPRDIIAMRDRRERAHDAREFRQSNGYFPMTKGWAVYNQANIPVRDQWGKEHLITPKRHQVMLWAMGRIALNTTSTSLREAAGELHISPQTVSNALQRFTAWGILGYAVVRGKYGGLILFARSKGDGLERFAREAWERLKRTWERRFVLKSNVHSIGRQGDRDPSTTTYLYGVDIKTRRADARRDRDDRIEAVLMGQRSGFMKRVPCPAHEGHDRNLAFWRRADGSLGVKCWSHQCAERDIKEAVERWEDVG